MRQYLDLSQRVIDEGKWVTNERTGEKCLTVISHNMCYNVAANEYPIVTTRKAPFKLAIAELLGYLRAYDNAADFRALGAPTWDANANENEAWLKNPHRKGTNDMGRCYGVVARDWPKTGGGSIDLLRNIYDDLKRGYDSRGEILTYWNPGEFHLGCLRPCLYEHQFSILDGTLYLDSTQRSADIPLGVVANMQQCFVLLKLMAQITGLKPGLANHKLINCHIYEPQLPLMRDVQLKREPLPLPQLEINPEIKTLEDVETWVTPEDFKLVGYEHWDAIKYPFTV